MRLLFLTPGFAAGPQDHNCIPPLQMLARELAAKGVGVDIIALEYPFSDRPYTFAPGVEVYPCNGRNRRWLRWRTRARALRYAGELLRDQPCDALHSFWLGPAWVLGEQLARTFRLPHRCTLMGQDVLPQNRYLKQLDPEQAARLIALTPFHNDMLEKSTGLRAAKVIPWGTEAPAVPPDHLKPRPVDVLGVGSLIPVKDWERWLRVLRLVADKRPGLCAELIGNGPQEARLLRTAQALQLDQQVRFAGTLPRPAVLARMRDSRVLLHTARFESFGMVLAEAADAGCRIVSTPVGIAPALGRCATTDAELAQLLLSALEDPARGTPSFRMADTTEAYRALFTQGA